MLLNNFLECQPASGKHNVHDVKLVNLSYVSDVKVLKEADRDISPPPLSNLNVQKVCLLILPLGQAVDESVGIC